MPESTLHLSDANLDIVLLCSFGDWRDITDSTSKFLTIGPDADGKDTVKSADGWYEAQRDAILARVPRKAESPSVALTNAELNALSIKDGKALLKACQAFFNDANAVHDEDSPKEPSSKKLPEGTDTTQPSTNLT